MTFENLEAAVLALPKDSQAALITKLLEHFGNSDDIDRDTEAAWLEVAEQRDRELDDDSAIGIPAAEVFQRIRASLQ
jgi:hypothetical protein